MHKDLRSFLNLLREENELVEITAEVDPYLEGAEIHRRVIASGGPALLFKNIKGAKFPLVTNLFGTARRVELAFGTRPEAFIKKLSQIPEILMPPTAGKIWQQRRFLFDALSVGLKRRNSAKVKENCQSPSRLTDLPLLTTWEQDSGAFITLPLVYTEHPKTRIHNLGMYRLQRFDDESTGLHCQIGKGGGFHLSAAKALNQKLPVNIFIGGPPALMLAAIAPLPENVPELLFASLAMGEKLRLSKQPFSELPLVANAEFALVGEVDPQEMRPEGPFGDHYGYYSLKHDYPVFRCKALYHRDDAICTATVVGKPRQEDFFIGDYLQEMLAPLFPLVMPSVKDLWSYGETGYHSLAAAVVQERYKREACVSAFRILGEGQLALTKFLLVTDKQQNLKDFKSLLEYILARANFKTDLYIFSNLSMDTLDYTGPEVNKGSKGVLLGLGEAIRECAREFSGELAQGVQKVEVFCKGCLVVSGKSYNEDPDFASRIATNFKNQKFPLVILVDDAEKACASTQSFLWTVFTRFEPAADIYAGKTEIDRNHIVYGEPIVIDARMKGSYPDELLCDERTQRLVSSRWREYFQKS